MINKNDFIGIFIYAFATVFLDLILKISGGNMFAKIGYRYCFYNARIDNIIYLSYY